MNTPTFEEQVRASLTPETESGLDADRLLARGRRSRLGRQVGLGAGVVGLVTLAAIVVPSISLGGGAGVPAVPAATASGGSGVAGKAWDPRVMNVGAYVASFPVQPLANVRPGSNAAIDWSENPTQKAVAAKALSSGADDAHELYATAGTFTRTPWGPVVWSGRDGIVALCTIWPASDLWGQECFAHATGSNAEAAASYFVVMPKAGEVVPAGATFVRTKATYAVVTLADGRASTAVLTRMTTIGDDWTSVTWSMPNGRGTGPIKLYLLDDAGKILEAVQVT